MLSVLFYHSFGLAALLLWLSVARVGVQAADGSASILVDDAGRTSNQSLFWGAYRPNLYFGVRPRIPKSLMTGLLWARVEDFQTVQNNFRHTCEQHAGMAGYGWDEYDVRSGGRQTIHDAGNHIDITTEFVKVPGGNHGGSWAVRIKGKPRLEASADTKTTVVFYAGLEGLGSLEVANERDTLGYERAVSLKGTAAGLGDFQIDVTAGPESNRQPSLVHQAHTDKPLDRTLVYSTHIPEGSLWQVKNVLFTQLKTEIDGYIAKYGEENIPPPWQAFTISNDPGQGNLHLVQKVFEGAFEFDILYSSGSAALPVDSDILTKEINTIAKSFSERFEQIFSPNAPFKGQEFLKFSKEMFSNLVGGIGYFSGDSVVDRSYSAEYEEENEGFWEEAAEARSRGNEKLEGPSELYTSIPSRPFFPRGFLWDEGFHLLPILDWDPDLALQIIKSWFSLMDEDGWIAREQILGDEARSKVPREFQVQYPHYANPPTLFLVLGAYLDKLELTSNSTISSEVLNSQAIPKVYTTYLDSKEVALQYLRNIYPLLRQQYFWFRKTQWGDIKSYDRKASSLKEAYRWRGRTPQHILTSGLDDYPRPQPPHPGELHVDLISWMGMMTRTLKRIAGTIGESDDVVELSGYEEAILRNIDDLHWSDDLKTFCDATIDDYEEHVHVCHKGYISLFPFMTGLLPPNSPRLVHVLNLIEDPEELWSPYGIRSLSKSNEYYGTDENYWRSPIWVNMNYLIILRLLELAQTSGAHQAQARRIYTKLRKNIVQTVFDQWKDTGFAWEQYNPETGAGQRTQHFTGWTSLVVKIMKMPDFGGSQTHDEL